MTQQDNDRAQDQARAQLASIREMLAAASLDWDRLEELRNERDELADHLAECEAAYNFHDSDNTKSTPEWADLEAAREELAEWEDFNGEELADLEQTAGDYDSREEAEEAIYNDPLDIQFRSGWSGREENLTPEEFYILLCTGGPAVRIIGELDHTGQPCSAWLEHQDWGTPWTMLFDGQSDALEYAQRLIVL